MERKERRTRSELEPLGHFALAFAAGAAAAAGDAAEGAAEGLSAAGGVLVVLGLFGLFVEVGWDGEVFDRGEDGGVEWGGDVWVCAGMSEMEEMHMDMGYGRRETYG